MLRRNFFLLFLFSLGISLLAACAGDDGVDGQGLANANSQPANGQTTSPPREVEKEQEPKPEPRETVEISIYNINGTWDQAQNDRVYADPVSKKFPHIQLKAITYAGKDQLEQLVVAGESPDLFISTPGPGFEGSVRKYEFQTDLTPYIKKHNYDLDLLDEAAIGVVRSLAEGDELYSFPIYMAPNTLYYNKALFDKFAVNYPKDGMTWDEFYELSRDLTRNDEGVQYHAFMLSYPHLFRQNQISQNMFDETGEKAGFDTPEFKNYLQDVFRIFQLPGYDLSGSLNWIPNFVSDQTLAMLEPGGTLLDEEALAPLDNEWDFTSFPSVAGMPGVGYQPYPFILSMASNSKHPDETFEAMAYLTSEEFQAESTRNGSILPVLKDKSLVALFGQNSEMYQGKNVGALLPEQFAGVPDEPVTKYTSLAHDALYSIFGKVLREDKDINTAFREATESANMAIEEAKKSLQ